MINTVSKYLVGLTSLLFLLLYSILSYYNRAASDDIIFTEMVKNRSVVEAVFEIYTTWSGRWASWGYLFALLSSGDNFQNLHHFIFIYHCITIIILIYSINTIFCIGIKKIFDTTINTFILLIFTILFIAGFYYSTFDHIEVWWWVCASVYYLQGIVFLLLGIALLIKENKTILHYIVIGASFLYVGASFELYIFILSFLIVSLFIYIYLVDHTIWAKIKKSNYFNGIVLAIICFAGSAIVCFIAPGNYERRNLFDNTILDSPTLNASTLIQTKNITYIALVMLFTLLGIELKSKNLKNKLNVKMILFFAGLPFLISIIISYAFQFFILYDHPIPLRGWTFTSFCFHCFLSTVFLFIGYQFNFSKLFYQLSIKIILPIIIVAFLAFTTYKQYNYVSKYSSEYDKQLTDLIQAKKNKAKSFYVTPLPNSGMLIYLYMDDHIARSLTTILNLDFEIKLKNR